MKQRLAAHGRWSYIRGEALKIDPLLGEQTRYIPDNARAVIADQFHRDRFPGA
ncbi:hypothetical protein D3C77_776480 [compost metagenome]